jgi:hypothetical protein
MRFQTSYAPSSSSTNHQKEVAMKCTLSHFTVFTLAMIVCIASVSFAQDGKKFATKGSSELGGSISFQSLTPVSNGNTGDATTIFSLAPFIGYFVTDGFEIGLNPLGITSISYSGSSATQIMILAAPSYNFKTEGIVYPFIEALLGYSSQSNGSTRSGFSWGGRGGVKLAVTDTGLLNLGIQYVQITLNPSGATNRYGSNQLAISAGFTVWF